MRVNLVKIGNSRGIIIPSPLLAACNLGVDKTRLLGKAGRIDATPWHPVLLEMFA